MNRYEEDQKLLNELLNKGQILMLVYIIITRNNNDS